MCRQSPDKSTRVPREQQTQRVSLHPGTGIMQPSAQNRTTAESQITNAIVKQRINRMSFRAQRTSPDSVGCSEIYPLQIVPLSVTLQPQISVKFPSAQAFIFSPLSFGVTKPVK
jgi:hypothetical protein